MKTGNAFQSVGITLLALAAFAVAFSQSPTPPPDEPVPPASEAEPSEPSTPMPLVVLGSRHVHFVDPSTRTSLFSIDIGQFPEAAVLGQDGESVYVLTSGRDSPEADKPVDVGKLLIINTKTRALEKTLPLGWNPTRILVARERGAVFVLNEGAGRPKQEAKRGHASVLVLDIASREVVSEIEIPPNPVDLAYSEETGHLFVLSAGYRTPSDASQGPAIAVIDPSKTEIDRLLPLPGVPTGFLGVHGQLLVNVEEAHAGRVMVYEVASHELINQLPVSDPNVTLVVNPDGTAVHLCSENKLLTLVNGMNVPSIALDAPCRGVEVSEDGSRVVVATRKSTYLVDGPDRSVIGRIETGYPLGCTGCSLFVSPDGKRSIIVDPMEGAIRLLDNERRQRIENAGGFGRKSVLIGKALGMAVSAAAGAVGGIPVGGHITITGSINFAAMSSPGLQGGAAGFSDDARYLYAVNGFTGDLCVFDLVQGKRVGMFPLPGARGIVVPPGGKYVFALGRDRTLVLVRRTGQLAEGLQLPAVAAVYFDADARHAFFIEGGQISVVDNVDGGVEAPIRGIPDARSMAFPQIGS